MGGLVSPIICFPFLFSTQNILFNEITPFFGQIYMNLTFEPPQRKKT